MRTPCAWADAHITIGLALAEVLAEKKEELSGVFKLAPARRGGRPRRRAVAEAVSSAMRTTFSAHVGMGVPSGTVAPECGDFSAPRIRPDLHGQGRPRRRAPNEGGTLCSPPPRRPSVRRHPHKDGTTRLNVGCFRRKRPNVIPAKAPEVETGAHGRPQHLRHDRYGGAAGVASMYRVTMNLEKMGRPWTPSPTSWCGSSPKSRRRRGVTVAPRVPWGRTSVAHARRPEGSGKAVYFVLGADIAGHHNSTSTWTKRFSHGPALFTNSRWPWKKSVKGEWTGGL